MRKITTIEIIVLAILLIGLVYYFFVNIPINNKITALTNEQADLENEVAVSAGKLNETRKMQAAVDAAFADGTPIPIPDYSHINAVIAELNTILAPANTYNVSFGSDSINDGIAKRTISISYTAANYESAVEMLTLIQESDNQYLIENVNISGSTVDSTKPCNVTLNMVCYEFVNEEAKATA